MKIVYKGNRHLRRKTQTFRLTCPHCDSIFEFTDDEVDKRVRTSFLDDTHPWGFINCPVCGQELPIYISNRIDSKLVEEISENNDSKSLDELLAKRKETNEIPIAKKITTEMPRGFYKKYIDD